MKGRLLVDAPHLGLKCGEYADIPETEAKNLIAAGHFDPKAAAPGETESAALATSETAAHKPAKKRQA